MMSSLAVVRPHRRRGLFNPPVTVAATVAAMVALAAAGSVLQDELPAAAGHALGHLVAALPLAFLLAAVLRRWPPAREAFPGRLGRRLVVAGLAGVVLGQVLEVLGARVDERGATAVEAAAHVAGQVVTLLCLPVLLAGTVASLVAGVRERALPGFVVALVAGAGAAALWLSVGGA